MSKDRDDELNSSPEFSLEEILAEFGGGGQRDDAPSAGGPDLPWPEARHAPPPQNVVPFPGMRAQDPPAEEAPSEGRRLRRRSFPASAAGKPKSPRLRKGPGVSRGRDARPFRRASSI
ncbi:MAG: hypothetical protein ACLSAF_04780 [Intestinimonas sp.]